MCQPIHLTKCTVNIFFSYCYFRNYYEDKII